MSLYMNLLLAIPLSAFITFIAIFLMSQITGIIDEKYIKNYNSTIKTIYWITTGTIAGFLSTVVFIKTLLFLIT
jgi:hypothetical protein